MAFRVLPDANIAQIIQAGNMAFNIVTEPINPRDCASLTITYIWTGNPVGAFSIQVPVDYNQDADGAVITEPAAWQDLPLSADIDANGVADSAYIEFKTIAAPFMRIVWAAVSGTGVLDAFITGKPGNPT